MTQPRPHSVKLQKEEEMQWAGCSVPDGKPFIRIPTSGPRARHSSWSPALQGPCSLSEAADASWPEAAKPASPTGKEASDLLPSQGSGTQTTGRENAS